MKKKKKQNLILAGIAAAIVIGIISYNISAEQTRQKGFTFGVELEKIQTEVKDLQTQFYSQKTQWEEGSISKQELFDYYEIHVNDFEEVISKYDQLNAPESFQPVVELLKLSSESQLEGDREYIKWMETGNESNLIRSDTLMQQSLEYELTGLQEFEAAKRGIDKEDLNP